LHHHIAISAKMSNAKNSLYNSERMNETKDSPMAAAFDSLIGQFGNGMIAAYNCCMPALTWTSHLLSQ